MLNEKKSLRRLMRLRRAELNEAIFLALSDEIEKRCAGLPEIEATQTIHIYLSAVNHEVNTHRLITTLLDRGKRVVVPRCDTEPGKLKHIRINSLEELKPSRFGLLEPDHVPQSEVTSAELDLIIAPLLAFDRSGRRLGFGGGYYDYLFGHSACPKIGLAYAFQEVEHIPSEPHDRKLDIIVTEKEIIRIQ